MIRFVSSVFLFVSDIKKSQVWYEKLLGYSPNYVDERFAEFKFGTTSLCLHLADEKSPVTTGGCVAYWWVDDFEGVVQKMISSGGKIYRGPIATVENRQICQILDPFGNILGLEGGIGDVRIGGRTT